jgi:cobalamin biosynthesis Mg chelatase CobN
MIQRKTVRKSDPSVSPFLGIGEGKVKAAKAAAAAQSAASAMQQTQTEALIALAGANVAAQKAAAETAVIEAKAAADKQAAKNAVSITNADSGMGMYYIIGGIVVVLMAGLYFIIKARKK